MGHLISLLLLILLNILASTPYAQSQNTILMNTIDSCWRSNPNWSTNRQTLANCAAGFGGATTGGKNGPTYVVTDPSDDPQNPKQGTLRHGVAQGGPLWITFANDDDMSIALKSVLRVSGSKTVDGRGAKIEIGNGPCMELRGVKNVIVHGIRFSGCRGEREGLGDAITVIGSSDVWIDHCFFSRSGDGLIDVVQGSSHVTISNNHFTQHDKVMLLGNDDNHTPDKDMRVTVAFNYFGAGLGQRMPRVRHGYAHVANNRFERWQNYAIGGSANPTIFSEGNYFIAANSKEVTERHNVGGDEWKNWTWKSSRDVFQNGAFFTQSGSGSYTPNYSPSQSFTIAHGSSVPTLTSSAGPLQCTTNKTC